MSWYYFPLAVALVFAAAGVVATKTPRGIIWLVGLTCSFVVSVAYLKLYQGLEAAIVDRGYRSSIRDAIVLYKDWLPPSAIAVTCDLCLAWSVAKFGREKWETRLLLPVILAMVLVNLLVMTGLILGWPPLPGQNFIGIILEGANYVALAIIGGTGIVQHVGAQHATRNTGRAGLPHHSGRVLGRVLDFGRSLRQEHKFRFWG